jgi:hypothetical protein
MTIDTLSLQVHPIGAGELDDIRQNGLDRFGNVPEESVSEGGDQLRCCLRLSEPGERVWLIAHAPLTAQRPWREVGPVFVHADRCPGYPLRSGLPGFLHGGRRVLRSYTHDQAMYYPGNRVTVAGDDLVAILLELFADPRIAEVDIRNVEAQCFLARVTR